MKKGLLRTIVPAAALLVAAPLAPAAEEKEGDIYKTLDILCDVIGIIQRDYIEKLSSEKLMQDALRGMLASLDSYSTYSPAPAARQTPAAGAAKELGTYGLEVAYRDRLLTVVAPVEGGPAWRAGMKGGDIIIKLDKETLEDRPLAEILHLFRGGAERELHIQAVRRGERDFLDFTLKPGAVEGPPARSEDLGEKIGLLRISRFDRETAPRIAECLRKLKAGGADGLVVDLRDCPAGEMNAAIAAADHFVPAGEVVTELKGRAKGASREFRSRGAPLLPGVPTVVLVNGGTSGAAEVFAGALQAGGRGVLMGQRSFGCAFEEGSFSLKDGSLITMLTAVYHTPDGAEIQDEGLDPDIDVPLPTVAGEEEAEDEEGIALPPEEGEKGEKGEKGVKGEKGAGGEEAGEGADPMVQRAVDLIKGLRIMRSQAKK